MNFLVARANMVTQQVQPWYVTDKQVLDALSSIPREQFVPAAYANLAYSDTAIPLSKGQKMLPPKVIGRALQALSFTGQEKVLEIGTGTGYVTACLSQLAKEVISLEIQDDLLKEAQKNLDQLHCHNVTLEQIDAVHGYDKYAPYDVIMINGSFPLGVPDKIMQQLRIPGKLFAITGLAPSMQAVLIERQGKTEFSTRSMFETVVPPLIHATCPPQFKW